MKGCYREVTFRNGRPLAGYFYLPREAGDHSARVEKRGPGQLVDLTESGRPIGIEIAIPALVTVEDVNECPWTRIFTQLVNLKCYAPRVPRNRRFLGV